MQWSPTVCSTVPLLLAAFLAQQPACTCHACAATPDADAPLGACEADKLVQQAIEDLASQDFDRRREASERLMEAGTSAIEPLTRAAGQADLEVAARSVQLLLRIGMKGDVETGEAVVRALETLTDSNNRSVASRAAQALDRHRTYLTSGIVRLVLESGGSLLVVPEGRRAVHVKTPEDIPAEWIGVQAVDLKRSREITAENLKHIGQLAELKVLLLGRTGIDDSLLEHVTSLTELQELDLGTTSVTGDGLAQLKPLRKLKTLWLNGTRIDAGGLAHLEELKKLRSLDLEGTPVADAGLAHLQPLESLVALHLSGTRITDAGLERLSKLPRLQTLDLSRTKVTDTGLEHLAGLRRLEFLDVRGTRVSAAGVARLRAANAALVVRQ
jgi:hypothetical protein